MGHRQDEFALWKELLKADPKYDTFSASSTPGGSKIAFWMAQQILAGKHPVGDVPEEGWDEPSPGGD